MTISISQLTEEKKKAMLKKARIIDDGPIAMIEYMEELEEKVNDKMAMLSGIYEKKINELKKQIPDMDTVLQSVRGTQGKAGDKGDRGKDGKDGYNGKNGKDGEKGKDGKDGRNGKDGDKGKDGKNGKDGENGKDGSIKELAPQEVRDLLELLQDDERLDAKYIKGLEKKKEAEFQFVGSPGSGGKVVKVYDLSAQLNGILATFSLPAFWRVVSVNASSSPYILQPTTDYTVDSTAMSITFTNTINPATTLAVGQTVIILYAET